jgi:hypothetical protein
VRRTLARLTVATVLVALAAWQIGLRMRSRTEHRTPHTTAATAEARVPTDGLAAEGSRRARIEARVWRRGAPTAAEVELRVRDDARLVARTDTDADGRFRFEVVECDEYHVFATAEDARGGARASLYVAGQRVAVDVHLAAETTTLEGTIAWADGRPFTGIVRACEDEGRHAPVAAGHTDANGAFTLAGLPRRALRIEAIDPGRVEACDFPVYVPFDGAYRFVVDGGLRWRTGLVLRSDDDTPIAGARVTVSTEIPLVDGSFGGENRLRIVVVTGEDGRFEIRNVPAGTYEIEAWHERLGTQTATVTVEDGGSATSDLTFSTP